MGTAAGLAIYAALISLLGFIAMGIDKRRAKRGNWRVPEKSLFLIAALGGAPGVLSGMRVFHHKTKHKSFTIGVPVLLILDLILVGAIYWRLNQ